MMEAQIGDLAAWLAVIGIVVFFGWLLYRVGRWLSPTVVGILIALGVIE